MANKASGDRAPVYEVLAHDIKAMGVEAVFGLMSDDTALLATSLDAAGVRFYGARHENAAIAMVDGYAYATGRLGVAVIGRGLALANGLHSAVYASRTGRSVLIIYGEAATIGAPERSRTRLQGARRGRHPARCGLAYLLRDESRGIASNASRRRRRGAPRQRCESTSADQCPTLRDRAICGAPGRTGRS